MSNSNSIIYSPDEFFASRAKQILSAYNNVDAHVQPVAVADAGTNLAPQVNPVEPTNPIDVPASAQGGDVTPTEPTNVAKSEDAEVEEDKPAVEDETNKEEVVEKSEAADIIAETPITSLRDLGISNEIVLNNLTKGEEFEIGADRTFAGYDYAFTEQGWKLK